MTHDQATTFSLIMPFLVFFIGFRSIALRLMLGSARPFLVQYTHAFVYPIDHVDFLSMFQKLGYALYILCLIVLCDISSTDTLLHYLPILHPLEITALRYDIITRSLNLDT